MKISSIKDDINDYVQTQVDVVKLKVIETGEKVIAGSILGVALAFLSIFVLMFLSFAAAYAISGATGRPFLGFLIVGGFYLLLTILIAAFKQKLLDAPIIHMLMKKLKYKEKRISSHV